MGLEWQDAPSEPGWWLEAYLPTESHPSADMIFIHAGNIEDPAYRAHPGWKYLGPLPPFPKEETSDGKD